MSKGVKTTLDMPECAGGRKTRKVKKRRLSKRARAYKSRSKLRGKSLRR
jgi:hypothetical protein